jgi:hypothetical protein
MPKRQAVALAVLLAACSDDSSNDDSVIYDAGPPVDAGAECSAEATVNEQPNSAPGGNSQVFRRDLVLPDGGVEGTEVVWSWVVSGSGDAPDYFTFRFDETKDHVKDTTFQLAEACNSDVAPCWILETDVTVDNEGYHPTQTFFPEAGTLVVHEVSETRLRATFMGAWFHHYLEGPTGWSPASDHATCATQVVPTIELDVEIGAAAPATKPRPMR